MDRTNKIRFCTIIDVRSAFYIERVNTDYGHRAGVTLYLNKEELPFVLAYLKDILPTVKYKIQRLKLIRLKFQNTKNTKILLDHIREYIYFKKERLDCLCRFSLHRMSENKKRYNSIDDEFRKEIDKINGK